MADLFLDIRDRHIRAIVSDSGKMVFQGKYALKTPQRDIHTRNEQHQDSHELALHEGELSNLIATIRTDAAITIDQAHIIIPTTDVLCDTHRLPRMAQEDALKLLTRKNTEKTGDETANISLIPMAIEQNSQEWLIESVSSDTLRAYKKELSAARVKLKTVTTALDSTLHAVTRIRESIFNAHAILEINAASIEAYYISASTLLLHETLHISDDDELNNDRETERAQKRRVFAILDQLYHVNAQFQSAHPMTPLQKIWLCGTDTNIAELTAVLQDAMDVETSLFAEADDGPFVALNGFWEAFQGERVNNLMHAVLLNRFPLRKKTGLLIYIATILLTLFFVITAEYRHNRLMKQVINENQAFSAQKASQSSSPVFVKNLELLRKLAGSQVILYPIFRELAMNLPAGVFLDAFSYSSKDNHDTIDINATFVQSNDLGTQKTLTKLTETMSQSSYLSHYREPSIISTTSALKKTMTVKFTCEVNPLDTAK